MLSFPVRFVLMSSHDACWRGKMVKFDLLLNAKMELFDNESSIVHLKHILKIILESESYISGYF